MAYDLYQSAALILRYAFSAAGAYIAGRAAYMTFKDAGRAAYLRSRSERAGAVCELLLKDKRGDVRKYLLPREGCAGAGRACDVRIASAGLSRRHFYFEMVSGELRLTALNGAFMGLERENPLNSFGVAPGGYFYAGDARFRYVVLRTKAKPLSPMTLRAYGKSLRHVLKYN